MGKNTDAAVGIDQVNTLTEGAASAHQPLLGSSTDSTDSDTSSDSDVKSPHSPASPLTPKPLAAEAKSDNKDQAASAEETKRYSRVCDRINETLAWVKLHPGRAVFWNFKRSWRDLLWSDRSYWTLQDENDVHRVLYQCCNLGFGDRVLQIADKFALVSASPKEKAQLFLNELYNIFTEVNVAYARMPGASFKEIEILKTYIDAFAENHDLGRKLFNFKDLANEIGPVYSVDNFKNDCQIHYLRLKHEFDELYIKFTAILKLLPDPKKNLTDEEKDIRRKNIENANGIFSQLVKLKTHIYVFIKKHKYKHHGLFQDEVTQFDGEKGIIDSIDANSISPNINYLDHKLVKEFRQKFTNDDQEKVDKLYVDETYLGWVDSWADIKNGKRKVAKRVKTTPELPEKGYGVVNFFEDGLKVLLCMTLIGIPLAMYLFPDVNAYFRRAINKTEGEWEKRQHDANLNRWSKVISIVLAIGEGVVAGVLASGVGFGLPVCIFIGIAGLITNYFLMRNSSFNILREWFTFNDDGVRMLYCDKDGNAVSNAKRWAIRFTLLSTFMGGMTYGFLSYNAFMAVGAAIFAATPAGWMVLGAFVATVSATALFILFYRGMAKLIAKMEFNTNVTKEFIENYQIQNETGLKILNALGFIICPVVNYFVETFKYPRNGDYMQGHEKAAHICRVSLRFLLTLAAWALTVTVSFAMAGLFRESAMSLLSNSWGMAEHSANILVAVFFDGFGAMCNAVFFGEGIFGVRGLLEKVITFVPSAIYFLCTEGWAASKIELGKKWNSFFNGTVAAWIKIKEYFFQMPIVLTALAGNTLGQLSGTLKSEKAQSYVQAELSAINVTPTNADAGIIGSISTAGGSGAPNTDATLSAIKTGMHANDTKKPAERAHLLAKNGIFGENNPANAKIIKEFTQEYEGQFLPTAEVTQARCS